MDPRLSQHQLTTAAQLSRAVYNLKPDWLLHTEGDTTYLAIEGSDELIDWRRNFEFLLTADDCHIGFKNYATLLLAQLLVEGVRLDAGNHLILCGHSLGGAVATVIASQLQGHIPRLSLVTFGSPRPGGRKFREHFKVPHIRFVHGDDVVPHLPSSWLGFRHTVPAERLKVPGDSLRLGVADHDMDGYRVAVDNHAL